MWGCSGDCRGLPTPLCSWLPFRVLSSTFIHSRIQAMRDVSASYVAVCRALESTAAMMSAAAAAPGTGHGGSGSGKTAAASGPAAGNAASTAGDASPVSSVAAAAAAFGGFGSGGCFKSCPGGALLHVLASEAQVREGPRAAGWLGAAPRPCGPMSSCMPLPRAAP
mgnify:CR=1 FL=1